MDSVRSTVDRESRSIRRIEAFLYRQDGREMKAMLTNVSKRGCEIRPQHLLAIDELVRIEVPRLGSFAATIRWMTDGRAGAEFIPQSDIWEEVSESGA